MSRPNDEGHRANGAPQDQIQIQHGHFAPGGDKDKVFTKMQARAALCGCTLHVLADGGFLVGKWNYSRAVPCLRAVGDMLRQMGARE